MTIATALEILRNPGTVCVSNGHIKLRFPEKDRKQLQPAIDILRTGKAEALVLLGESVTERRVTPINTEPTTTEPIESVLKNRAIELWSTAAGRLFLVVEEADARQAMERFGARRGEIYTAAEARRIIAVNDPAVVAEIHDWKQRFDGVVRELRVEDHPK